MSNGLRIPVWTEAVHESTGSPAGMATDYPDGLHGAIAAGLMVAAESAEFAVHGVAAPNDPDAVAVAITEGVVLDACPVGVEVAVADAASDPADRGRRPHRPSA